MFTPNYLVLMASHMGMSLSQALPAEEVTIATVNTVRHLTFFFHSHHLYKERFINKKAVPPTSVSGSLTALSQVGPGHHLIILLVSTNLFISNFRYLKYVIVYVKCRVKKEINNYTKENCVIKKYGILLKILLFHFLIIFQYLFSNHGFNASIGKKI